MALRSRLTSVVHKNSVQPTIKAEKLTVHASYHVTYRYRVKNNYIFRIHNPNLAIHFDTFTALRWRIRGVYFWAANVKGEIERKFSVPERAKFWQFSGPGGQGLEKVFIFTAKGTSICGSMSFETFCMKIGWVCGLQVGWGKIKKVTNIVYFTYLPRSPCWSYHHQICSGGRFPGHNQLCQISFSGFDFLGGGRNLAFPIGMSCCR